MLKFFDFESKERKQARAAGINPDALFTLEGHTKPVRALAVLPNGQLASGSEDNTIKLWDARGGCVATLAGHTSGVTALAALPNGQLASGSWDNTIKLWDARGGCVATLAGHTGGVIALAALPNGQLASGSWDNTIKLWDVRGGCVATLAGHTKPVRAITALPNGQLASGSWDNTIKLWDARGGCVATLAGHTKSVYALAALPNGQLASGSWDKSLKLWDVSTETRLETLEGHTKSVNALAALPNGQLASGSRDNTIKLWDARGGCVATLEGHTNWVYALTVLPNGQLASGSEDYTIKLWDVGCRPVLLLEKSEAARGEAKAIGVGGDKKPAAVDPVNTALEAMAMGGAGTGLQTILFSALTLGRVLGEGGFGIVYQGAWQRTDVAIKQLKVARLSASAVTSFADEARQHAALRHPHIVALFSVCVEVGHYSMVMEYMPQGSLYDVLHTKEKALPWSLRLTMARHIAVGLAYLHDQSILHRDLKSLNVLLDNQMNAKLSDFGLSKEVKKETGSTMTSAQPAVGSILWMAPELFKRGAKHDNLSDIYALGIVFWELSSRELPFHADETATPELIKDWVKDGERETIPSDTPPAFAALITRCWAQRTGDRPANVGVVLDALSAPPPPPDIADSGYRLQSR
ncbi:MAG: protein kinase [Gammaproteobacteria bacterium]|nr:protein kinase [Gammaproteobacteria bacterium]